MGWAEPSVVGRDLHRFDWSGDRVEQLRSLVAEGLSASEVARALGGRAVPQRRHRQGIAPRIAFRRRHHDARHGSSNGRQCPAAAQTGCARASGGADADPRAGRADDRRRIVGLDHGAEGARLPLADRRRGRDRLPLLRQRAAGRALLLRIPPGEVARQSCLGRQREALGALARTLGRRPHRHSGVLRWR
ncbi:MAG: hypothetical protein ISS15_05465 [Alphaproteobacteria bacterium]|nr:hypothetical protein [Alphaproteobacteria bacterium]MBL6939431.1 hypothetical protein [Alphaproteobacteria bacterium]MBL7097088.1 hypothetical protein [Alphaproteobacteria bacterium]